MRFMGSCSFLALAVMMLCLTILTETRSVEEEHHYREIRDKVDCQRCGDQCKPMCGTRGFRACCLSFVRRRRVPNSLDDLNPPIEGKDLSPRILDYSNNSNGYSDS